MGVAALPEVPWGWQRCRRCHGGGSFAGGAMGVAALPEVPWGW